MKMRKLENISDAEIWLCKAFFRIKNHKAKEENDLWFKKIFSPGLEQAMKIIIQMLETDKYGEMPFDLIEKLEKENPSK